MKMSVSADSEPSLVVPGELYRLALVSALGFVYACLWGDGAVCLLRSPDVFVVVEVRRSLQRTSCVSVKIIIAGSGLTGWLLDVSPGEFRRVDPKRN